MNNYKSPVDPDAAVLVRLIGLTRILSKGNDRKIATAAARRRRELVKELESLQS